MKPMQDDAGRAKLQHALECTAPFRCSVTFTHLFVAIRDQELLQLTHSKSFIKYFCATYHVNRLFSISCAAQYYANSHFNTEINTNIPTLPALETTRTVDR
jgi:hypothetical protein